MREIEERRGEVVIMRSNRRTFHTHNYTDNIRCVLSNGSKKMNILHYTGKGRRKSTSNRWLCFSKSEAYSIKNLQYIQHKMYYLYTHFEP